MLDIEQTLWQIPCKPHRRDESIILVLAPSKEEAIAKVRAHYDTLTNPDYSGSPHMKDKVHYDRAMPFGQDIAFTWI